MLRNEQKRHTSGSRRVATRLEPRAQTTKLFVVCAPFSHLLRVGREEGRREARDVF